MIESRIADPAAAEARRPGGQTPPPIRLAVIDSDTGFLRVLQKRLSAAGWQHRVLASAVPLETIVAMRLNAVVIDLSTLGPHGWNYLERLCTTMPGLGVIVCTGQSTVAQRVRGLRLGADDWMTKPCHPEELIARVEAVVRRRKRAEARVEAGPVVVGEVEIRAEQFQAFAGGRSVDLTRREFELIDLLAGAPGQVLQREEIYQRVWGYAMAHGDRSVDVFVRKVRQKLERASPGWRYIHTHFGIGYRFAAEPVDAPPEGGREEASAAGVRAAPQHRAPAATEPAATAPGPGAIAAPALHGPALAGSAAGGGERSPER
jgi:DNA-binding response OmpR family regulator